VNSKKKQFKFYKKQKKRNLRKGKMILMKLKRKKKQMNLKMKNLRMTNQYLIQMIEKVNQKQ